LPTVERVLKVLPQLQLTVDLAVFGMDRRLSWDHLPVLRTALRLPGRASDRKRARSLSLAPPQYKGPPGKGVPRVHLSTKSVDKSVGKGSPQRPIARHFCISVDLDTK
jgi:hypothetical protein